MLGDRGSALGYFFIGQVGKERAADAEQVDAFMGIEFLVLNGKKSVDDVWSMFPGGLVLLGSIV